MAEKTMTFNDIQPTVWDRFKRAKKNNRIGTAYLFTGPRGCGKEWGAIQFAKYLNCENAGEISCEKCSSCSKFFGLQHPNLKLIVPLPGRDKSTQSTNPLDSLKKEDLAYLTDAIVQKGTDPFFKINVPGARRITINAVRDLRKTIYLKSQSGGRKMVLIFDAHLLSEGMGESANALLKILEEPPKNTTLILVSDKKLALLPTIISRCQPMNFPALNLDQTRQLLEQDGVENETAFQLAMVARGDVYLAKELSEQSRGDILEKAEALAKLMMKVDTKGWRDFINNNAILAVRKPDEFKFKLYLLQLWFHHAYEMRSGMAAKGYLSGLAPSLEKFNETYPNANLAGINKILEDTVESLVRNLYTPLTLTNLLISVQELLKGKIPRSSV
tara:strand:+ start:1047 stop:2207 length:1161 start_codon:yes stop_codon:yes gene_type:complete